MFSIKGALVAIGLIATGIAIGRFDKQPHDSAPQLIALNASILDDTPAANSDVAEWRARSRQTLDRNRAREASQKATQIAELKTFLPDEVEAGKKSFSQKSDPYTKLCLVGGNAGRTPIVLIFHTALKVYVFTSGSSGLDTHPLISSHGDDGVEVAGIRMSEGKKYIRALFEERELLKKADGFAFAVQEINLKRDGDADVIWMNAKPVSARSYPDERTDVHIATEWHCEDAAGRYLGPITGE